MGFATFSAVHIDKSLSDEFLVDEFIIRARVRVAGKEEKNVSHSFFFGIR